MNYLRIVALGLLFSLPLVFFECGSKEDPQAVHDDLKYTAEEFFQSVCFGNFQRAQQFCTNESKASIKKLEKFYDSYLEIYYLSVDSCTLVNDGHALCECSYYYSSSDDQKVSLEINKYEDEWLVSFLLDENFDNIFMYDYSTELNETTNWKHKSLALDEAKFVEGVLQELNSNEWVIGFSLESQIQDFNLRWNEAVSEGLGLPISVESKSYSYSDWNALGLLEIEIEFTDGRDHNDYWKDMIALTSKQLGAPFNISKDEFKNGYQYSALRWFVKGANEIFELVNNGYGFTINLYAIE